ncbi:MAG: ATP phosphoribosyltransferase regulatory subunit [Clostridia bacterium]|nr:ATP phosphoribosyltransferase regulatory subunit [Clostridia bacterium]
MQSSELFLSFNEKVVYALRSLYSSRGYSQYKMSKFEEYDLYARNKDFLISDSVITFTDTSGKLMALKPDVTLSIIKNTKDNPETIQRVFYNENVYRISMGSHTYKEIMQAGLECFGDIDCYSICEVITLAAESLRIISDSCVLDISHLGLLENILESFCVPNFARADILKLIGEKNTHELAKLCASLGMESEDIEILKLLISTSGTPTEVLPKLANVLAGKTDISPIKQLQTVFDSIDDALKPLLHIDFSVVNDIKYYNGIVFKGFIEGIPTSVLSGGQYDKLMKKMNRRSGAIGFAAYLDMLDRFNLPPNEYDVDVLLIYSKDTDLSALNAYANTLLENGETVFVCKAIPENIKYRKCVNFDEEVTDGETNA